MDDDLKEIEELLRTYFDGVHENDIEKLGAVFDPCSHLFSVKDGELKDVSRDEWFELLRSRESGKAQGLARDDQAVTIDRSGPATALAKVRCQLPPRYFTDYLTLARLSGGWRIVSKTYHEETRE